MTELEIMQRARMYMDMLSHGVDPITGQPLPGDTALNNPRLARCFGYVSGVLDQVIANGGHVGAIEKKDFSITAEQLARTQIAPHPVRITELADALVRATGDPAMKRPSAVKFSNWLTAKGYLTKEEGPDGKSRRIPTALGASLGISTQTRQSPDGDYVAIYYDANAQRFLLDHIREILQ